jgi:hypothetical protein
MKTKTKWVHIQNDGEIEFGGLHLMGISSKRGDSEKIGFFGSGNKYSIALLLREKIPFKIFSGKKEIKFTTDTVMFRGQTYEQICINGEPTSLTTAMGIDWETWFAVREMYCNAVDEGGAKLTVTDKTKGEEGKTSVFIELTDKLSEFFSKIDKYILVNKDKMLTESKTEYGNVEVYSSDGKEFVCYRKGIRIMPANSIVSMFSYNFDSIEINESRVYKYEHDVKERIASFLANTDRRDIISHYLARWKGSYEADAKWEYVCDSLSEVWHDILKEQRVYPESLAMDTGDYEGKRNAFIVPDKLAEKIANQFEDVDVVGAGKREHYETVEMTVAERVKMDKAITQLAKIGFDITSKIALAVTTTKDVIAWYDMETDTIYHTRKYLAEHDVREIKNTLVEEHLHSQGHMDGQREFVTYLIHQLIDEREKSV